MAEVSEKIKATVKAIHEEGGDNAVQKRLQAEIQRTKKMETETAQFRKKAEQNKRDTEKLNLTLSKLLKTKVDLDGQIKSATSNFERIKLQQELYVKEMAADRDRIEVSTLQQVSDVNLKMEEENKKAEEMEEENKKLEEEFNEKKAGIDEIMEEMQSAFKVNETESKLLGEKLTKVNGEKYALEMEKDALVKHIKALMEKANELRLRGQLYSSKAGEFQMSIDQSDEVMKLGGERLKQLETDLQTVVDQKGEMISRKKEVDQDTVKLRQQIQQIKKKVQQAEKTKVAVEAKCRDAQRKADAKAAAA